MKIEIRLRIDAGDGGLGDEELLVLDKPHDQLEQVGLSLAEAKELLGRVQERVVGAQASAFLADNRRCGARGKRPERAHMDILKNATRTILRCRTSRWMTDNVPGSEHELGRPRHAMSVMPALAL